MIVNEPAPKLVEFTVTVEPVPRHTVVADGEVKLLTSGCALTLNVEVLPLDNVLVHGVAFVIAVTVTVVEPAVPSNPNGILKLPVPPTVVSDALFPEDVFAPVRL